MISNIIRRATRKHDDLLNILTFSTHAPYQTSLAKTGHEFWHFDGFGDIVAWDNKCRVKPDNIHLLRSENLPTGVVFDLLLSHNHGAHYRAAHKFSRQLHIPHVELCHILPPPNWGKNILDTLKQERADFNYFITEYSREFWGWKPDEADVIEHGIDTNVFCPDDKAHKDQHVLSVANLFKERDWCLGYTQWEQATNGLPRLHVGNDKDPSFSQGSKCVDELVYRYRSAVVFINTSLISPIPTSLLEAAACGCAIVSTATCAIPEIFTHGQDALLSNNPITMREYIIRLFNDENLRISLGKAARDMVLRRFSEVRFVADWNRIFEKACQLTSIY